MPPENSALWLLTRGAKLEVGPAPYTAPGANEVVVRVRAVAVNPVDGIPGIAYRVILPWLKFPTVIGSDVAGEVVEVGANVSRLRPGQRVLGHAAGLEQNRNRPAEGAFQLFTVLMQHMVSPIPDSLAFEQAAVLPLAVSTAASGMFQPDQLALALPKIGAAAREETVLVWGGSTSVGSNAIQLARSAGYRVLATASPHNFDYVRSLGAAGAVDYHSRTAVEEVLAALDGGSLAGALAIGAGSLTAVLAIARRAPGRRRVATAYPTPIARARAIWERRRGVGLSLIWGGTLKDNEVGPAIYADFLPAALAGGAYRAAPEARVVGEGLTQIPVAIDQLRKGVSATKLVVRL